MLLEGAEEVWDRRPRCGRKRPDRRQVERSGRNRAGGLACERACVRHVSPNTGHPPMGPGDTVLAFVLAAALCGAGRRVSWPRVPRTAKSLTDAVLELAPDRGSELKVDGQQQLDRRCAHGLVKQLIDRGLPFQLLRRVRIHPLSLDAAGRPSAEGHGMGGPIRMQE